MMAWWSEQALVALAIPVLGAALGTMFWSKPRVIKVWGLLVITTTWLIVAVPSWMSEAPATISLSLLHLILAGGFLTILGQHPNKETPVSLCLTLLFTGLGLGYVASGGHTGSIIFGGIFGLLSLTLFRHRRPGRDVPWYAIGALALGILSLILSVVYPDPFRIFILLIPLAIAWPLWPVQGVFVASVSSLPGMLPAFLAVLLPSVGFFGMTSVLPVLPEGALNLLWVIALVSALYGSLLALSQNSIEGLLAYAQMALGSILWWVIAVSQTVAPGAVIYLGGLTLVICGLLLAGLHIRTRFGYLDLNTSHGLAHTMPGFSVLFVLLITAALGLPIFTLFSAFMEMMLGLSSTPVGSLALILLLWFMASWYFPRLMQQVLFGQPSRQFTAGHNLYVDERWALILLLALLVMLDMAPPHWFGTVDPTVQMIHVSFGISQDGIWKH
ncbi:MAG: hypothetical protein KC594_15575 [Nitrospira sp.]|nr:hypothetical protein [Nitrospira sp.]